MSPGGLLSTGTGATDRAADSELVGAAGVAVEAVAEALEETPVGAVEVWFEPEEGEQVVEGFLNVRKDILLEEQQRILPGAHEAQGGADSFFIARFTRNNRG